MHWQGQLQHMPSTDSVGVDELPEEGLPFVLCAMVCSLPISLQLVCSNHFKMMHMIHVPL